MSAKMVVTIKQALFNVVTCRSETVRTVVLPVVEHADYIGCDYANKHEGRVFRAVKMRPRRCEACYDQDICVQFAGFIGETVSTDCDEYGIKLG